MGHDCASLHLKYCPQWSPVVDEKSLCHLTLGAYGVQARFNDTKMHGFPMRPTIYGF